jgi:hypothetical protein
MFVSSQASESVLVFAAGVASFGERAIDRVGNRYRDRYLRLHSLENGALLASEIFEHDDHYYGGSGGERTCEPALPGRLWCPQGGKGLTVRDAESLRIIAEQRQILGGTPELAGEPLFDDMRVDPKTRGFVFESRDGYAWIIDPTTLAPSRFAGTVGSIPRPGDALRPSPGPVIGDCAYSLDGGTRVTLERRAQPTQGGTPLHPEHTYLRGKFVWSRNVPVVLDNPPRLLVVEEVLDHGFTLWSVLADGTAQWRVIDLPEVLDAKLYRDTVVIVTRTMLVALRTQNGATVWTSPP